MKSNKRLIREIISDVKHDMSDEEILNMLADSRISANPKKERYTLGQRAADKIAKFAGSWQLGIYIFVYGGACYLDGGQCSACKACI